MRVEDVLKVKAFAWYMEETGFEPWHWKTKQNTKNNSKTVYE
jgi:hypothetical protein